MDDFVSGILCWNPREHGALPGMQHLLWPEESFGKVLSLVLILVQNLSLVVKKHIQCNHEELREHQPKSASFSYKCEYKWQQREVNTPEGKQDKTNWIWLSISLVLLTQLEEEHQGLGWVEKWTILGAPSRQRGLPEKQLGKSLPAQGGVCCPALPPQSRQTQVNIVNQTGALLEYLKLDLLKCKRLGGGGRGVLSQRSLASWSLCQEPKFLQKLGWNCLQAVQEQMENEFYYVLMWLRGCSCASGVTYQFWRVCGLN